MLTHFNSLGAAVGALLVLAACGPAPHATQQITRVSAVQFVGAQTPPIWLSDDLLGVTVSGKTSTVLGLPKGCQPTEIPAVYSISQDSLTYAGPQGVCFKHGQWTEDLGYSLVDFGPDFAAYIKFYDKGLVFKWRQSAPHLVEPVDSVIPERVTHHDRWYFDTYIGKYLPGKMLMSMHYDKLKKAFLVEMGSGISSPKTRGLGEFAWISPSGSVEPLAIPAAVRNPELPMVNHLPAWSAKGLVLMSLPNQPTKGLCNQLSLVEPGGAERLLISGELRASNNFISPDGCRLAYGRSPTSKTCARDLSTLEIMNICQK